MASVSTASYGVPYPSCDAFYARLKGEKMGDVVKAAFKSAYKSENLDLIGETNRALTLPNGGVPEDYSSKNYRNWQWKFDTIYGFFSCTVNDVSVFNEETLRKAVEASERERLKKVFTRSDTKKVEALTKVCQVLLSEEFAKKLLTEPLLQALYDNKDAAYSCFDVKFSPDAIEENVFRFDVTYSQTVKEAEREAKEAFVFALCFSFGYDVKKDDFGGDRVDDNGKCWGSNQPQLEYLGVDGHSVRSNFFNFDERLMERVWRHPYSTLCEGKEKILREEKEAVAEEEEREISERSKEGLGLEEEEEENWNDVFEGKVGKSEGGLGLEEDEEDLKVHAEEHEEEDEEAEASELRGPNKRPRTFNFSEDEASEKNFKKKKK